MDASSRHRLRLRLRPAGAVLRRRSAQPRGLARRHRPRARGAPRAPPALADAARARSWPRAGRPGRRARGRGRLADPPATVAVAHRPAGRALRRAALHAAQGHHRHQARPSASPPTHGVPAVPVFWIDSEDHDWEEVRRCTVLDDDQVPHTVTAADVEGAGVRPIARLTLDGQAAAAVDALAAGAAGHRVHRRTCSQLLRAAYAAGRGMSRRVRPACSTTCSAPTAWSSTTPPTRPTKPLARRLFAEGAGRSRPDVDAGRRRRRGARGPRLSRAGRLPPSDAAPLFLIDGSRAVDPLPRRHRRRRRPARCRSPSSSRWPSARPSASAPTCCCARWCRTRSSPPSATSAARASWPTSGSCARSTPTSRVPMPLVVPRASASVVDSATLRFLAKHDVPFAAVPAPGRAHAQPAAREPAAAGGRDAASPTPARRSAERLEAVTAAAPSRRRHARGRGQIDARQDAARPAGAARQGRARGQEEGRDPAPAVQPDADAALPERPAAGTGARPGLAAQPLRPGRRRPPDRGCCRSTTATTGCSRSDARAAATERSLAARWTERGCRARSVVAAAAPVDARRCSGGRAAGLRASPAWPATTTAGCRWSSRRGSHGERVRVIPRVYGRPLSLRVGLTLSEHRRRRSGSTTSATRSASGPRGPGEFALGPRRHRGRAARRRLRRADAAARSGRPQPRPPDAAARRPARPPTHRAAVRRRDGRSSHVALDPPLLSALVTTSRERRRRVPLAAIPAHVQQAVLAIEDRRFYRHPGIDPIRIVGALVTNLRGTRTYLVGRQHHHPAAGPQLLPDRGDGARGSSRASARSAASCSSSSWRWCSRRRRPRKRSSSCT